MNNSNQNHYDLYWSKFLNRLERVVGWFLFITGILILVSYGLYQFIMVLLKDTQLSLLVKAGIFLTVVGFVLLLFSVVRERLTLRKKDKYSEVNQ
ncbi:MAG: hypothetical protein NUV92_07295 [Ignavibacteria bacterium]|jgi:uncharacterized membrane protein|nr:hypothetical protein [Ignavibacteria bacterium]MDH7528297.1 hypothetical protein [Ignavibacteria bacterium]